MEDNRKKAMKIIYILSVLSLVTSVCVNVYNVLYGKTIMGHYDSQTIEIFAWLLLALSVLLVLSVIINFFTKDKFYWLEIAVNIVSLIVTIVSIIMVAKGYTNQLIATYEMVKFEAVASLAVLLFSKLCIRFVGRKGETKK